MRNPIKLREITVDADEILYFTNYVGRNSAYPMYYYFYILFKNGRDRTIQSQVESEVAADLKILNDYFEGNKPLKQEKFEDRCRESGGVGCTCPEGRCFIKLAFGERK